MKRLIKKIELLKEKLYRLGAFQIGVVHEQYNVCGKEGCSCTAAKNPKKHGPYWYLHWVLEGKQRNRFLTKEQARRAKVWVKNYKRFKELNQELAKAYIELGEASNFGEDDKNG